jgi:hypothetical protein
LEPWVAAANVEALTAYVDGTAYDGEKSDVAAVLGRPATSFSSFCGKVLKRYVQRQSDGFSQSTVAAAPKTTAAAPAGAVAEF